MQILQNTCRNGLVTEIIYFAAGKVFIFCSTGPLLKHLYANMPVQYAAIFKDCKNVNFQMKKNDIFLFFFAQNIDCGYNEAVLTSTHNLCFKEKKYIPLLYEPRREKTGFLHMRKQRRRSASL